MSKNQNTIQEDKLESVESALTRTELFIEENQKTLTYAVLGVLVVVVAFIAVTRFYLAPKNNDAQSAMFVAEQYFERDSFNLALNGDGNNFGFLDIINDYKFTKSANLSCYYAGISYLHLGEYEDAIKYLKKFDSDDLMVGPVALGAIGDAYAELSEYGKGISYYEKAAEKNENEFISPIYLQKAAQLYEVNGQYDKALKTYEVIKEKYPKSQEARNAEKNITRAKLELGI